MKSKVFLEWTDYTSEFQRLLCISDTDDGSSVTESVSLNAIYSMSIISQKFEAHLYAPNWFGEVKLRKHIGTSFVVYVEQFVMSVVIPQAITSQFHCICVNAES